jgi:hypothetical protein
MGAIREIFRRAAHILRLWHVERNVLPRCKGFFSSAEAWATFFGHWRELLRSPTPESYSEALGDLRARYPGNSVIDYVAKTWLLYKEALVKVWTNRALHFGISTTSRVEGSHSALKGYLQVSTGNLHAVTERVGLLLANHAVEHRAEKAQALTQIGGGLRIPLFVSQVGLISPMALGKLLEQRARLTDDQRRASDPCIGVFRMTMGLPCAHELGDRERAGGCLALGIYIPIGYSIGREPFPWL